MIFFFVFIFSWFFRFLLLTKLMNEAGDRENEEGGGTGDGMCMRVRNRRGETRVASLVLYANELECLAPAYLELDSRTGM